MIKFSLKIRNYEDLELYRQTFFNLYFNVKDKRDDLFFSLKLFENYILFEFYRFKGFKDYLIDFLEKEKIFLNKKKIKIIYELLRITFF
jgi:hypothetical protein